MVLGPLDQLVNSMPFSEKLPCNITQTPGDNFDKNVYRNVYQLLVLSVKKASIELFNFLT